MNRSLNLKRWQAQSVLAITLEAGRIAIDLVRLENGVVRRARSLCLPLGAEAVLADPEQAGRELAALLDGSAIRERRMVVALPPGWALTAAIDLPAISAADLRGYLELRAEREFPVAVTELGLAHSAYALPGGTRRATLAGIPLKRVEAVERMLGQANGRVVSLSLGLEGCLGAGTKAAFHLLAHGNQVDATVSAGGGIVTLRSLAGAEAHGTPFDGVAFSREIRITLGRLPDAIRQPICGVRIAGAPAVARELFETVREPLSRIGLESRLEPVAEGEPGAAAESAGRFLKGEPVAFEVVAPKPNRWADFATRFDNRRRRWAMAAAVGCLLLPVFAFILRSHTESSLETEWEGMRRNVGELETLQQKIRQFRPWFEPAPVSVQTLEGLVAAFPEPGDVWAKSIQLSGGSTVTCSGSARNQASLTALLDRLRSRSDVSGLQLQQVRGENPVQFSFTYKWEPAHGN